MSDRISPLESQRQIAYVVDSLSNGRLVDQSDIKTAVQSANELRKTNNFYRGHVTLAFEIGNYHFWRTGDPRDIVFDPDEELAASLSELQQHALTALRVNLDMVPQINCTYLPRDPNDIQRDADFAEHQLLVVEKSLGELIAQSSSKRNS